MTPLEPDRICVKRYSIAKEVQTMRPLVLQPGELLTFLVNRTLTLFGRTSQLIPVERNLLHTTLAP